MSYILIKKYLAVVLIMIKILGEHYIKCLFGINFICLLCIAGIEESARAYPNMSRHYDVVGLCLPCKGTAQQG